MAHSHFLKNTSIIDATYSLFNSRIFIGIRSTVGNSITEYTQQVEHESYYSI